MQWVASTLHTTSEHGVSSITTADAHTSAASSRTELTPRRFIWTRPFRRKTKSDFCACAITFQMQSTITTSIITPRQLLTLMPSVCKVPALESRTRDCFIVTDIFCGFHHPRRQPPPTRPSSANAGINLKWVNPLHFT